MYLITCTKDQFWEYFSEFDATEESVKDAVRYLREWMEQEQYLPKLKDDNQLVNFLFRGKNNLERTKRMIDRYYTSRAMMPEVFAHLDPCSKDFSTLIRKLAYVPMPKLTPDGCRVLIFHIFEPFGDFVPTENGILHANQIALDMLVWLDQNRGCIVLFNLENMSLQFVRLLLLILKKLFVLTTKVAPLRYKKVYVLNVQPFAESMVLFGKSLAKKELAHRIQLWKDPVDRLTDVLPKECLPREFGGSERSLVELRDEFYEDVRNYKDWFSAEAELKADLSKKPRDVKYSASEFGVDGSFRKINLD